MLYLVAVVLPPLAVLLAGKPFQAIISFILQLTLIGWALRGEDRSVRRLEELAAELLGKEAGLLLPTCSSANLFGLLALGARGGAVAAAREALDG